MDRCNLYKLVYILSERLINSLDGADVANIFAILRILSHRPSSLYSIHVQLKVIHFIHARIAAMLQCERLQYTDRATNVGQLLERNLPIRYKKSGSYQLATITLGGSIGKYHVFSKFYIPCRLDRVDFTSHREF